VIVGVVPDVPALAGRTFHYAVPATMAGRVEIGTLVRVPLAGRRIGGWVVDVDIASDVPEASLKPIAKVTGVGPRADVIELARWAAWRWAGRLSNLLTAASPPGAVVALAAPARRPPAPALRFEPAGPVTVVRTPPAADLLDLLASICALGPAVIVCPTVALATHYGSRLRKAGVEIALAPRDWARIAAGGCSAIGARAAVWAPVPDLAAIVVLDEHDEVLADERAPTWHARDVAVERARRAGVPCVLCSPLPTLEALALGPEIEPTVASERAGWGRIHVIDRSSEDPFRSGPFSESLTAWLRRAGRVVCVVNRTGRAASLSCKTCGHATVCERCAAGVAQDAERTLVCRRCGTTRPQVCQRCGSTKLASRRPGTARLAEELSSLLQEPVAEVTGAARDGDVPTGRVIVGTEAALHRVGDVSTVVFLDFDAELLAPRYRASEHALGLLARAARVVGGRAGDGRVVVQTREPDHEVIRAVVLARPEEVGEIERVRRRALGFPPFSAIAQVSGAAAEEFVRQLVGVELLGPSDGSWLVRAPDHRTLCDGLASVPHPGGRELRVAVDPLRI
jgi:primosomal protein N' (replication factor Y) (superfamily II helicase)